MLITRQTALRRFWYPVMPAAVLDDGGLHPFTLLGEPIVLWRAANGEPACLRDRCCHRTARLSLGFLEGDDVVCGYHGWTFSPEGRCVRVPQQPAGTPIAANACVPAYRVQERYGYVWVTLAAPGQEPLADLPDLPQDADPAFRRIDEFHEEWGIGALRLMENSFDNAHVAYVHRATFGDVQDPRPNLYRITAQGKYGFEATTHYRVVVRGETAQRAIGSDEAETVREQTSAWFMPFVRRTGIRYPNGLAHVIVTCATPIDDRRSMILQWVYRNDTEQEASAASVIAFDRAVTLEDKAILESCDPDVPLAVVDGEELHMASDRPGLVMRGMFMSLLAEAGETEQRAPSPWAPVTPPRAVEQQPA
ncbi:aromatic ring-hydroxylating dioxygenase subunit alpha [Xylophilus sp. GOD-11R]|uniref:aromatic ring-hydroxylating dioxygenase subunit alpha n=1 Tax=Xylophilus sp. GOD-11R TaxID=3089814 RepID=UPI00298C355B|nr:aromatic ring-hydroxylating dioxygenase subunit alpha [Xylophilus sp. GOD-11R]WPB56135.1 aromatic ring-hydroxylating dioxygenase subunit alpha [Xylophilus sp. GOD-11R]